MRNHRRSLATSFLVCGVTIAAAVLVLSAFAHVLARGLSQL